MGKLAEMQKKYPDAPPLVLEAILDFSENGTPSGGFVTAVLENDLSGAFARADLASRAGLADIVRFIHWEIPHNSHGSREAVSAWTGSGNG